MNIFSLDESSFRYFIVFPFPKKRSFWRSVHIETHNFSGPMHTPSRASPLNSTQLNTVAGALFSLSSLQQHCRYASGPPFHVQTKTSYLCVQFSFNESLRWLWILINSATRNLLGEQVLCAQRSTRYRGDLAVTSSVNCWTFITPEIFIVVKCFRGSRKIAEKEIKNNFRITIQPWHVSLEINEWMSCDGEIFLVHFDNHRISKIEFLFVFAVDWWNKSSWLSIGRGFFYFTTKQLGCCCLIDAKSFMF